MKLKIYLAPSGQWAGIVLENGDEIARIAGCESPEDVEAAAVDQWPEIESIEVA